jgi:2-succinyl-5-enolpyruvyl-6-hydroxy-3-cyclohexene-1-carboxylate synthase
MSSSVRSAPLTVVASRGLAGIDGCVSTAVGLALAQPQRPAFALMGDLTFLHDLNGLAIPAIERDRMRLQIVVANDDGGGIFATLEHASHPEAFERVFGTPVGADLASLCAGYGVLHRKVQLADLPDALDVIHRGVTVVEIATSRANLARLHAIL